MSPSLDDETYQPAFRRIPTAVGRNTKVSRTSFGRSRRLAAITLLCAGVVSLAACGGDDGYAPIDPTTSSPPTTTASSTTVAPPTTTATTGACSPAMSSAAAVSDPSTPPPTTTATTAPCAADKGKGSPAKCSQSDALAADWKGGITVHNADQLDGADLAGFNLAYYIGEALGVTGLAELLAEADCSPVAVRVDADLNGLSASGAEEYLKKFTEGQPHASIVTSMNHAADGSVAGINARVAAIRSVVGQNTKICVEVDAHPTGDREENKKLLASYMHGADCLFGGYYPYGGSTLYGGDDLIAPSGADMVTVAGANAVGMVQYFPWSSEPATAEFFGFTETGTPPVATVVAHAKAFWGSGVHHIIVMTQGETANKVADAGKILAGI